MYHITFLFSELGLLAADKLIKLMRELAHLLNLYSKLLTVA
jgi:hypothetical protein